MKFQDWCTLPAAAPCRLQGHTQGQIMVPGPGSMPSDLPIYRQASLGGCSLRLSITGCAIERPDTDQELQERVHAATAHNSQWGEPPAGRIGSNLCWGSTAGTSSTEPHSSAAPCRREAFNSSGCVMGLRVSHSGCQRC